MCLAHCHLKKYTFNFVTQKKSLVIFIQLQPVKALNLDDNVRVFNHIIFSLKVRVHNEIKPFTFIIQTITNRLSKCPTWSKDNDPVILLMTVDMSN